MFFNKIPSLTEQLKSHAPGISEGLDFCSCACDVEILIALEKQELKLANSNCKYYLIIIVSVISCIHIATFLFQYFYIGSLLLFTYFDVTRKHNKGSNNIFIQKLWDALLL